jgi:hypothetical protein
MCISVYIYFFGDRSLSFRTRKLNNFVFDKRSEALCICIFVHINGKFTKSFKPVPYQHSFVYYTMPVLFFYWENVLNM